MKRVWYILFLIATLVLACRREEKPEQDSHASGETRTIHYIVSASSSAPVKASLNGDTQYIFEEGDRLCVCHNEGGEDKLYGVLSLISGAGERTARFEGDLICADGFEPTAATSLSVTLVGATDAIHSVSAGKVTTNPYPVGAYAADLATAVQNYSDFTCNTTYGETRFTLDQNTSFLVCRVKIHADDLPNATSVSASLINDGAPVWASTVNSVVNGYVSKLSFVIPLAGGSVTLTSASLSLEWTDALSESQTKSFVLSPGTLEANNYYTVNKTALFDGFRIRAKYDGTTMSFHFTDGSIEYSEDYGKNWTTYTGGDFSLDADDEICFRGTRTTCDCNGNNVHLFDADKLCYIAGKIGSLLADDTSLAQYAFRSAFSNGNSNNTNPANVTFVDIDPDDPLILPSVTSNNCYREMFRACTSLTHAPSLSATTVAEGCFFNMFRKCTGLTSVANIKLPAQDLQPDCYREIFRDCSGLTSVPVFPASTLAERCYQQMLSGCTSLTSITCLATDISATSCLDNWVQNIKTTGTFYKDPDMSSWVVGTNVPANWTITDYSE